MLTYDNVVGNQEDWANYVTNVDMRDTPFLDWLPTDSKPVNVLYNYQADKYADPRVNSHVDGQPWTEFNSAADNRGHLKSLVQWCDNTTSVSKLSQDVANPAGIEDELSTDILKRLKEMSRDMEVQMLGDADHREDNKVQGYLTRGVGSWIASSAQSLYPVPSGFLTPSASIDATASGSLTEDIVRNLLESVGTTTGAKEDIDLFAGPKLKRKFADFQYFTPGSTSTGATGVVYNSNANGAMTRSVSTYEGDYGVVNLILSWWNARVNSSAAIVSSVGATQNYRGYLLHKSKWCLRWNQKPQVYKPEFKGGSYEAAMDAISMLVCKNPQGEAKYAPTS